MTDKNEKIPRPETTNWVTTRRDFMSGTQMVIAGLALGLPFVRADGSDESAKLSFGIVTDSHYADSDARGERHYRESLDKMAECVRLMNDKKVDFMIELGDFKDQGKPAIEETTLLYLDAIEKVYARFKGPRYHVLGNHDVDSISKEQFLARVENTGVAQGSSYYSFDSHGFHCIVLDANYKADGSDYDRGNFDWRDTSLPLKELEWLRQDLASSSKPIIAFVHQQLDVAGATAVKNAAQVRQILQDSDKVLAVFQGHHHPGHYSNIEGIHYYTLKALVTGSGEQNNAYAIVDVYTDNSISITGYRKALSRELT